MTMRRAIGTTLLFAASCVSAFDLDDTVFSIRDVDITGTILVIAGAVLLVVIIIIACIIWRACKWRRNRKWDKWIDKTFHQDTDSEGESSDDEGEDVVKVTLAKVGGEEPMRLGSPKSPMRAQTTPAHSTPVHGDAVLSADRRYTAAGRVSVG